MKAFVHYKVPGMDGTSYSEIEEVEPKAGEVKVRLKSAGLNHRDLFVLHRHKETEPPLVIGSDGAGVVEEVGPGVDGIKVGDEVIINPSLGWKEKSDAPPEGHEILGLPDHGTFAEKITLSAENVGPKPAHLSWDEAGVLSLAAMTAYRALFSRAQLKATDTVLLPGIGSGAVTFLLLFAKAVGARVIVTSRSEAKLKRALELGADVAIDSNSDWNEALNGEKVDIVVETVGAATFHKSLGQLRKGGKMVTFGASAGDTVDFNLREFFYGQYTLLGSTMASTEEFHEMLQFVNEHKIKPVLDQVFPLEETANALKRIDEAEQFGKIAIKIEE
ncbi:NAD(P)-dependent alcohol dehydrogenase [Bacillus timonensis]|uniref:NAD(P)-dependent alcohol dehydrogenase n=1 Tax=Bacillus timonensis TaxID=1033734 RepID=A0A4S3PU25_9BACI|nr:zinc-binding dehydrogenase [Bacillus timonensis]THE13271.1 NAD(P)-dependent alcohol dehydrogenase [Bacillus timonensis]